MTFLLCFILAKESVQITRLGAEFCVIKEKGTVKGLARLL
jgi:hypothetical protein